MRTLKIAAITILTLLALTGLLCGWAYVSIFGTKAELREAKVLMEEHLTKKYDKQFVVGEPERVGYSESSRGHIEALAYPKDDPTLKFKVTSGSHDRYLEEVWARQARPEIARVVEEVFGGEEVWFEADIAIPVDVQDGLAKSLSFERDFSKVKNRGLLYGMHTRITSSDEFDEADHIDRVYRLLQFVKSKQVDDPSLRYVVDNPSENSMNVCDLYKEKLTKVSSESDLSGCFTSIAGLEGGER